MNRDEEGVPAASPSATDAARDATSPLGGPFRFTRRFRAFAHARLQARVHDVAMWPRAVAPHDVGRDIMRREGVGQDFLAAALLSAVFAAVAALGAKSEAHSAAS